MQKASLLLLVLAALAFVARVDWLFLALAALFIVMLFVESQPSPGGAGASGGGGGQGGPQQQVILQQSGGSWYDQFYADTIKQAVDDAKAEEKKKAEK